MSHLFTIEDFRGQAQKRLPRMVFDYLDGAAESEWGLQHNRQAFAGHVFVPKRLLDVSQRQQAVEVLGQIQPSPLIIAPTGLNGLLWPDGDAVLAERAHAQQMPFCLSTASNCSMERLRSRLPDARLWFQLYIFHREAARALVERAIEQGYEALIITVDVPVNGKRERDLRSGFQMPFRYTPKAVWDVLTHPHWALQYLRHGKPSMENLETSSEHNLELQAALLSRRMDASFDWQALDWLRKLWPRKLIVKGILDEADAVRCEQAGVDAIILSNHGARQVDSCVSPVDVLPSIRQAVSIDILVDSGIRRGSDVVKLMAMGANAVLVGRATLYGLAAAGPQGVERALEILHSEIDTTMANIGCPNLANIDAAYVRKL
ncbi:MAG: alpha-hydroxy-acid oxidizing protein [Comamonas sp.]